MSERAHAMLGRDSRQRGGRVPAPPQDHQRDQRRERDQNGGSLALGRAHKPDRCRWQAGPLQPRAQHVVDQHGHRAQRRRAGPQHRCIEAFQQLAGDIESDIRARLEVRADRPDRHAPLAHAQTVCKRPRRHLALQRRQSRGHLQPASQPLDPRLVQAKPVEHALVQPGGSRLAISPIGGQDPRAALARERRSRLQRSRDRIVGEQRRRAARRPRLDLHPVSKDRADTTPHDVLA